MRSFDFTIQDELGLHARPAGKLVKEAAKFNSKITLQKGKKSVDCTRLIALMTLVAKQNDVITITAEGDDEDAACEALENFCKSFL